MEQWILNPGVWVLYLFIGMVMAETLRFTSPEDKSITGFAIYMVITFVWPLAFASLAVAFFALCFYVRIQQLRKNKED